MNVKLIAKTPDIEKTIVYIARVSSSRKDKSEKVEGLINYLIKHKHWSPFEHGYITMEIETSKAIGIQLLRHRSFTFQEFSQRYQNVNELGDNIFEEIEFRKQAENNRQSSSEVIDDFMIDSSFYNEGYYLGFTDNKVKGSDELNELLDTSKKIYNNLIKAGVSRETARFILPMCTKTRIYMTGSVRSWIHFLQIRDDEHAQKEIVEVAKAIKSIFIEELPIISKALDWIK